MSGQTMNRALAAEEETSAGDEIAQPSTCTSDNKREETSGDQSSRTLNCELPCSTPGNATQPSTSTSDDKNEETSVEESSNKSNCALPAASVTLGDAAAAQPATSISDDKNEETSGEETTPPSTSTSDNKREETSGDQSSSKSNCEITADSRSTLDDATQPSTSTFEVKQEETLVEESSSIFKFDLTATTATQPSTSSEESSDDSDSGKEYYGKVVTLYHYTTVRGANGIKRDKKMKQNHRSQWTRHEKHGSGIYFTRRDPETNKTRDLIQNNFCRAGLRDETKFYDRMQYVVKITFGEGDPIEEINERYRDLFVHRGDIDLTRYVGRYRIYENPKAP